LPIPETTPELDTVATVALLVDHITFLLVAFDGETVAFSATLLFLATAALVEFNVTPSTFVVTVMDLLTVVAFAAPANLYVTLTVAFPAPTYFSRNPLGATTFALLVVTDCITPPAGGITRAILPVAPVEGIPAGRYDGAVSYIGVAVIAAAGMVIFAVALVALVPLAYSTGRLKYHSLKYWPLGAGPAVTVAVAPAAQYPPLPFVTVT